MSLLEIRNLRTHFKTPHGTVRAVDDVSLEVGSGDVLGIVGESGCGKSVLSLSILQLLPKPPAIFAGGNILFEGRDLLQATAEEVRKIRGNRISMIFQEPMSALNPVFTIGNQLSEVFRVHWSLGGARSAGKIRGNAGKSGGAGSAAADTGISLSAFGRHAAAGDDRHGPGLPTRAADRR